MFKWLRRRRETPTPIADEANRIVARSGDWGEPRSAPDPIAELVRIVDETHAADPRSRGNAGTLRTTARRKPFRVVAHRKRSAERRGARLANREAPFGNGGGGRGICRTRRRNFANIDSQ